MSLRRAIPVTLAISLIVFGGCASGFEPEYGLVSVKARGGRSVYLKRETRGLNYDVILISGSDDPCERPDISRNYVSSTAGPHVMFYAHDGSDDLTIFTTGPFKSEPPPLTSVPAKLVYLDLETRNEAYRQMSYAGATLLQVPLNLPGLQC